MEIQLKELLEKIKVEGVDAAKEEAVKIVQDAQNNAAKILNEASAKADSIVSDAKQKAAVLEASARESLKQAARDLLLSVDQDLQKKFNAILANAVASSLDSSVIKDSVVKIMEGWNPSAIADLSVFIDAKQFDAIKEGLFKSLSDEIKKGLQVQAGAVANGFKVMEKDGKAYFEFGAGSISDLLSNFLNPKLAEILKGV